MTHSTPWPQKHPVDPLLLKSTVELAKLIRDKEVSPTAIVEAHIRRIEQQHIAVAKHVEEAFGGWRPAELR